MDEENQNKQPNAVEELAKQGAKTAGKKIAREAGKQVANLAKKALIKLGAAIIGFIAAHIVPILIILAVIITLCVLIPAIDNYLDESSAETIDEVTYQTVQEYCTIDDTGIHIDKEEFLKNITVRLAENGIDLNSLGFGEDDNSLSDSNTILGTNINPNSQAAQYLYKFISASLAGEFPYIPGSDEETQGIIKIKRKKDKQEEAKDLTYIGYETFKQMLQSNDDSVKDDIVNYFSLDESWNLCIARTYKKTINTYSHDSLVSTVSEYTISEVKIPYRNMVSQYTVPFLFLIDLQLITNNANYVEAVAELMTKQSEIEFTIFDDITTNTNIYQYMATRHGWTPKVITSGNTVTGVSRTEWTSTQSDINDKTETIVETNFIKANVTKANTWIIRQETNYELQTDYEYPYGDAGTTNTLEDQADPGNHGSWDTNRKEYLYTENIINKWMKSGDTKTVITPSKFLGLWSNATGTYVRGAEYEPVGYGKSGKIVKYKRLNSTNNIDPVITNIITAKDELYDLLENSVTTQMHAELMRELIEFYESKEELSESTFINSAFISMYEPSEFVNDSYTGDFDVHDASLFITDLETLKKAFAGGYSKSDKLVANAQAFLDMQEKYQVNAIFAAAVSITETSAGRAGNAVNGCNNWFNITGSPGPNTKTVVTKKGETYHWRIYSSEHEGINAFGNLIANGSYYYTQGNYTVGTIGAIYCPNTAIHPTQANDWTSNTLAQMSRFYEAVGINISPIIEGNSSGGLDATGGDGYRGIYTTSDGKSYVEYLQYEGLWASKYFYGGTMKNSGCSITSVAVILTGFGIDVNPEDLRSQYSNGVNLESLIESYGLKCEVKSAKNTSKTEILNHLQTGNPVIINAGGYWTSSTGHFFPVLEALGGDQVYVSNVGSSTKTGAYSIDRVFESNKKVLYISR